jgi:hypothetical protein
MTVEINSEQDDWNDAAEKIKEEFDVDVVALQAGEPGNAYMGRAKEDDTTFRELIGTIEFIKDKMVENH